MDSLSLEQLEAFLNGPALTPPGGINTNFDHPPNGNYAVHVALAICTVISVVVLSLRLYSRIRTLHIADCKNADNPMCIYGRYANISC